MKVARFLAAGVLLAVTSSQAPCQEDAPADAARPPASEERRPQAVPRRTIEEIVVTAQKKEEALHDVPISMSVFDSDFLREQSVTDFIDLTRYVPNVRIDTQSALIDVRIRGFAADQVNKAFEQAVGLVIDGIPYGRPPYFQSGLLDLERVEVLRGPQAAVFGKNNSAGLLSMITKNPTDELSGFIDGQIGELDRRRFEAAVGGPVVPKLVNFRLAGLSEDRDGIAENTTARLSTITDERLGAIDRQGFRAKLGLPNVFGADLVLSYEKFDGRLGAGAPELRSAPQGLRDVAHLFDPNADFEPNRVSSIDAPNVLHRDVDTFVANAKYDLGGWALEAVGGHSKLGVNDVFEGDITPIPAVTVHQSDDNSQSTFELRVRSPGLPGMLGLDRLFDRALGKTEFLAGFFYQRRVLANSQTGVTFNTVGFPLFASASGLPLPGIPPPTPPFDIATVQSAPKEDTTLFFDQDSDAFAGFGQLDWTFAERWTLQGALRYSHEAKDATFERRADPAAVIAAAAGYEEFTQALSRSESEISPKVTGKWDVTDDIDVYASWGKGFRAGGFNEFATSADPATLVYDPETATSWELGAKTSLLGGAAELNVGLFRMTVTDFQVLTSDVEGGLVGFGLADSRVVNAGKARAQGVEADGLWFPTSWLTFRGALGFNHAKFLDFPFGPCTPDAPDTDGDGDVRCDLSGQPLRNAPKWTTTLIGSVNVPLASIPGLSATALAVPGVGLLGGLSFQYEDVRFTDSSLDPRSRQGPSYWLDGYAGFGNRDQGWSLRVIAKNLTNTYIARNIIATPGAAESFIGWPDDPRLVFGEFRWDW